MSFPLCKEGGRQFCTNSPRGIITTLPNEPFMEPARAHLLGLLLSSTDASPTPFSTAGISTGASPTRQTEARLAVQKRDPSYRSHRTGICQSRPS